MDPSIVINERVDIISSFARRGEISKLCIPRKMRWHGQEIVFSELALRHPTLQGRRMLHIFHVSDGVNGYRLEFDAEALTWTLVAMIAG